MGNILIVTILYGASRGFSATVKLSCCKGAGSWTPLVAAVNDNRQPQYNSSLQLSSHQPPGAYLEGAEPARAHPPKLSKIVATRCQILRLKCTKCNFGWGSAPDPVVGAYSAPTDPLAGLRKPTSKGREGSCLLYTSPSPRD